MLPEPQRVLFDGCSQKSFITQEVKNSLKINVVRNERILVRGFGGGDESPRNLEVVRAKITDIAEKSCTEVELYVVPVICSPICDQKIEVARDTYNHLNEFNVSRFFEWLIGT